MKITAIIAAGLISACLATAQAQSSEAHKENCCPGTNVSGQILNPCFENYQRAPIRADAMAVLSQFKTLVTEIFLSNGAWPAAGDAA